MHSSRCEGNPYGEEDDAELTEGLFISKFGILKLLTYDNAADYIKSNTEIFMTQPNRAEVEIQESKRMWFTQVLKKTSPVRVWYLRIVRIAKLLSRGLNVTGHIALEQVADEKQGKSDATDITICDWM